MNLYTVHNKNNPRRGIETWKIQDGHYLEASLEPGQKLISETSRRFGAETQFKAQRSYP